MKSGMNFLSFFLVLTLYSSGAVRAQWDGELAIAGANALATTSAQAKYLY
jgi:hypothetical protein